MSEIKPVHQRSSCGLEWADITRDFHSRYAGADGFIYRSLYPAAAYEAQRNEVERLQKENAELKYDIKYQDEIVESVVALSEKRRLQVVEKYAENEALVNDNEQQVKRIAELEIQNNHLQFLLDSVMLEYCPDEMTEEQMENWKKAQKKSNLEIL